MATPKHGTPFDFIDRQHFKAVTDRHEARVLFRRSVTMVELEVSSYCNRRCWFCPNSFVDRRSTNRHMDETLYLAILRQLAELPYEGTISFSRYNEPLADRIILSRLAQARETLPGATLHANTNGDYLTAGYLEDLAGAGLDELNIQIYLGNDERYDHDRMRGRLERYVEELGLAATVVIDQPGTWLEARAERHGVRLRLYARNFAANGCNRGGTVPIRAVPRTSPCLSPFHHMYLDFSGTVMPCCNLRSDVPTHADAVVGVLRDSEDLFLAYTGTRLAAWRRSLVGFQQKSGHCAGCSFVTFPETPANRQANDRLVQEARASAPEPPEAVGSQATSRTPPSAPPAIPSELRSTDTPRS